MLLEACVDSLELAVAAERGGAGRIELCERLDVGGTTPSRDLIARVVAAVRVPVFAIIRVRGGDFVHSAAEVDQMTRDAEMAVGAGAGGIVLGILKVDGAVDEAQTRRVMNAAPQVPATFHLAFDATRDMSEALDALAAIGIARVLTRGGGRTALDGVERLRELVARGGPVRIMAGGSIREGNAEEVVRRSGVTEIHSRGTDVAKILAAARRGETR